MNKTLCIGILLGALTLTGCSSKVSPEEKAKEFNQAIKEAKDKGNIEQYRALIEEANAYGESLKGEEKTAFDNVYDPDPMSKDVMDQPQGTDALGEDTLLGNEIKEPIEAEEGD